VLYELATGKDRHDFPQLPTLIGEGTTTDSGLLELNAVILKACQSDPKLRYRSAGEMRDDLLLLQSGKSVKRSQALERRLARGRKVTAVAAMFVLLTIGAVLFFQRQARREAALRQRAVAGELAARRNLYAADMHLAARALEENNRGQAVALLSKHLPENSSSTSDLRGWEWRMLWQQARSDELFTLGRHPKAVIAISIAPDGHTLYSASKDNTVGIWDLDSRRQIGSLLHSDALHDLDLSHDGQLLATSDMENVLRIWDLVTKKVRFARTNSVPLGFVRFTPDASQLVYRDTEGVWLIDPGNGVRVEISRQPHEEILWIATAAFSPDGRLFAYDEGNWNSPIHLLDWGSRVDLATFNTAAGSLGLAFSPDGRLLSAAGIDGLYVWDVASHRLVSHIEKTIEQDWSASPAFSPDGRLLATVSMDQRVQLWDTATWAEVVTLRGHEFEVWAARFTPDGSRLITASKDKSIRVWPILAKTTTAKVDTPVTAERRSSSTWNPAVDRVGLLPNDRVRAVLSRDGSELLVLHANGHWAVSDSATGRTRNTGAWFAPPSGVSNAGVSGDATRDNEFEWMFSRELVPSAAVSDDGMRVALGAVGKLVVFRDGAQREPLARLSEGPRMTEKDQNVLSFAPDGRHLLYATSDDAVRLLDITTGTTETVLDSIQRRMFSVNYSPDAGRIAAGYSGGWVQWMDLAAREIHQINTGHSEQVISLAFSPDGQMLATGSYDPGIKLWNLKDGMQLAELRGSKKYFGTIHFSPDGRRVAAGNAEGQISLWDLEQSPPQQVVNWTAHGSAEHPSAVSFLCFRSDGSLISRGDPRVPPKDGLRLWWAPSLDEIDRAGQAR
ncbi:MAG TPA: hypothetical protein PLX89_27800, partial [Verrucomicrobiota bacterium]|nr:hypothetical protein [Verrucomicrobiota bacterium]